MRYVTSGEGDGPRLEREVVVPALLRPGYRSLSLAVVDAVSTTPSVEREEQDAPMLRVLQYVYWLREEGRVKSEGRDVV